MSVKFPFNKVSSEVFTKSEAMISPKQVKERYLFGIDLTDDKGNELPDSVIQHYIDSSVSYLEHKLNIVITPTDFVERYDYQSVDYLEFNLITLKNSSFYFRAALDSFAF